MPKLSYIISFNQSYFRYLEKHPHFPDFHNFYYSIVSLSKKMYLECLIDEDDWKIGSTINWKVIS